MDTTRSLWGLTISQFVNSFNEYAWKLMVFSLATRGAMSLQLGATAGLLAFLVPMLLSSFVAGTLIDRFCKRRMILITRGMELTLLIGAAIALFLFPTNLYLPFGMLALLGVQSAFFNPAKGAILPEIVAKEKLAFGNGMLEMWTMIAVFAGFSLGPFLLSLDADGTKPHLTWTGPALLAAISFVGMVSSFVMPKGKAKQRERTSSPMEAVRVIFRDRGLAWMVLGNVIFWVVMTYTGQNILVTSKLMAQELGLGEMAQGALSAGSWLGIALGAVAAGRLTWDKVHLLPFAVGSGWFLAMYGCFSFFQPQLALATLLLALMGLSAGFLIVPLHAIVQGRAPCEQRGSVLAISNILNISGILAGSFLSLVIG